MPLDVPRALRASKIRVGQLRATGVPAILLGSAALVIAVGAARSLATVAPMLPETIREIKGLLESTNRGTRSLKP
jgi:hypothetical protein